MHGDIDKENDNIILDGDQAILGNKWISHIYKSGPEKQKGLRTILSYSR